MSGGAGRRLRPYLLAVPFLAGLGLATFVSWSRNDLDLFRWPMAELALRGHPLLIYSVHAGAWWSDNGPFSLVPLTAIAAIVNAVGLQADAPLRDAAVTAVFGVFALGCAAEAARAVVEVRGRPLSHPVAIWSALLLSPPLVIGMVSYGHAELPLELWLVLLAVRHLGRGRMALAGCLLGFALLTRTEVLLAALPLVLVLVSLGRLRSAIVLVAAAAAVTTAGLLPFLLADGRDVITSLVTYRGQVPVLGGSLLSVAVRTPATAFVEHHDALLFGGLAVLVTWIALLKGRAPALGASGVYALMALSTACLPLLAKSVWPYYLADPCAFATIWWLARPGSVESWRLSVPALFAAAAAALDAGAPGTCVALLIAVAIALLLADLIGVPGRVMSAGPSPGPQGRERQASAGSAAAVSPGA